MKRIAAVLMAMALTLGAGAAVVLPSVAGAASNSTCKQYHTCSAVTVGPPVSVSATTATTGTPTTTPSTVAATTATTTPVKSGTLPFTGIDVGLLVLGGAVLLCGGLFVRRLSREN